MQRVRAEWPSYSMVPKHGGCNIHKQLVTTHKDLLGRKAIGAARNITSVHAARTMLIQLSPKDGSIMATFKRVGKERLTFSHWQHTRAELW